MHTLKRFYYLEIHRRSPSRFHLPRSFFLVLIARALRPTHAYFTAFIIPPSFMSLSVPLILNGDFSLSSCLPSFRPSVRLSVCSFVRPSLLPFFFFFGYARMHTRTSAYIFAASLSLSRSNGCRRREAKSRQSMRTYAARYYVMPPDRGSDILCMLMLHNVGFVPLFSIYLFGSSLSPPRSRARSSLSRERTHRAVSYTCIYTLQCGHLFIVYTYIYIYL